MTRAGNFCPCTGLDQVPGRQTHSRRNTAAAGDWNVAEEKLVTWGIAGSPTWGIAGSQITVADS